MAKYIYNDDVDDGYPLKHKCSASSHQGAKQAEAPDYEIKGLINLRHHGDSSDLNEIQKCVGQIVAWYGEKDDEGDKLTKGGTGTVYKGLGNGYYLVITCAHNVFRINEATDKNEYAKRLWYLPEGEQHHKMRLKCVDSSVHELYKPTMKHCPYDIAIILCYDDDGYYKNVNINSAVHFTQYKGKRKQLSYCCIYGYPSKGEWKYRNLYTYPGQSGSVIYKSRNNDEDDEEEEYHIYGVHTYGNTETQRNRGVYLSKQHIQWIKDNEELMKGKATEHIQSRKQEEEKKEPKEIDKEKEHKNEIQLFLESLDVGYCYWLLEEQGCKYMSDLKSLNDSMLKEFGVNKYFDRNRILEGIKTYFETQKNNDNNKSKSKHHSYDDYEVKGLRTIDRTKNKQHPVYDCIGQLLMDYDGGLKDFDAGTGTVIKQLPNYHWVILTCAHNLIKYSKITKKTKEAKCVWFFPKGSSESKCRLQYVAKEIYDEYNPENDLCPGNLALVLFHDKKEENGQGALHLMDIEVDDVVQICEWRDGEEAVLGIYGYPTKSNGLLQGMKGEAKLMRKRGLWCYDDIYTYPGYSGAAIFNKISDKKYGIYGVHIFGALSTQESCGILLDSRKIEWINQVVAKFESMTKQ